LLLTFKKPKTKIQVKLNTHHYVETGFPPVDWQTYTSPSTTSFAPIYTSQVVLSKYERANKYKHLRHKRH